MIISHMKEKSVSFSDLFPKTHMFHKQHEVDRQGKEISVMGFTGWKAQSRILPFKIFNPCGTATGNATLLIYLGQLE